MNSDRRKVATLFALTLLITSLLLVNMNVGIGQVEPEPIYLHGPSLTPTHMHSKESLAPIHMNSNMTLTPVHMHYVGDPIIDPIYEPLGTPWHELYPEFCQNWILTSIEDTGQPYEQLSANDQIDMTDSEGNVTWYHVDRITLTMLLTNVTDPEDIMYVEFKGPPEAIDPIGFPVCTYWHEVYPNYCNVYHIIDTTGPLEYCTYILIENVTGGGLITEWHVEEVVTDLILREKIMDPICTWWHEIYPDYCKWWHITSWEDNGDRMLSPSDQIDMVDPDFWKWETFWSMGDANRDGLIDVLDVELIAEAFGSSPGDPRWNPDADLNQDGTVDMTDAGICAGNQGLDIWTYFDVTGPRSKKEWYHVDRVTLTLNVTLETDPSKWMKIELKTKLFEEMYNALKHPIETRWHEVYPDYSNVYELWGWDWMKDDNCNGVLDVCDYIWLYNVSSPELEPVRYHVEDICYDVILNKKIANPICTDWHEIYPEFCQNWHLTSWEDNQLEGELGHGILSPCDQIDMEDARWETFWSMGDTDRDGYIDDDDVDYIAYWFGWAGPPGVHRADLDKNGHVDAGDVAICAGNYGLDIWTYYPDLLEKTWYHVDRVTLTLYVTDNATGELYYFEYKGPFEDMYNVKTNPICSTWHMVWPYYEIYPEEPYHIEDWIDNCNGVLDYCDYIMIWGWWFHVEDLAIDVILNEKITDPVCTYWREIPEYYYEIPPEYWDEYHIVGWEDNDDGLLSPCDQIKMTLLPEGPTKEYHVEYVTLTLNITDADYPESWYLIEYAYEGPVETMYWAKTHPIGTWWYESGYPSGETFPIEDWVDNCNGVLDYCDYITFDPEGLYWYHVEDVAVDMTVTPKIHDVGVDRVESLYTWVYQGEIDPISVTVTNYGDFDEPTVDVYAFYDGTLAAPKKTTSLLVGETKTLTFDWDTTGVPPGFYTVSANATIPIDDVPGNNYLVGNVQEVRERPPPPPEVLDVELYPPEVVDLEGEWVLDTQWHELHPEKCNYYHVVGWEPDVVLSPEDLVLMDDTIFQVDDVTIDIEVVDLETGNRYWLDYECGYWTFDPEEPICTKWNEIKSEHFGPPEIPRCWHLTSWEDDGDGRLSAGDIIDMTPFPGPGYEPFPGHPVWFHVELVTVTLKLTQEGVLPPVQHYLEFMGTLEEFEAMDLIHVPWGTMWHEILPDQGRPWMLADWANTPFLSPSDQIWLALKDEAGTPIPGTEVEYHVDKMTVAMNITNMFDPGQRHIVKFEGSLKQFKNYHWYMEPWPGPIGTQWHEVNPTYCRQWYLWDWLDEHPDGYLGYCDYILMVDKETGEVIEFHVESISTDMWLTVKHDIAVTNVTSHKTVICQGCSGNVTVTVENQGYCTETFNVTAYANTTVIGKKQVTLPSGDSKAVVFTWDVPEDLPKGNYTIKATATPVPGEMDTLDNTFIDDFVIVSMMGDLTGSPDGWPDGKCNMKDISMVARGFGANHVKDPTSPKYCQYWHDTPCVICPHSPNCDVVYDGKINMKDISAVARHFGETDP